MQKPLHELLESEQLRLFLQATRQFCDFLAAPAPTDPTAFLRATQLHLLSLYSTATELEWVDLQSDGEFEETIPAGHFERIIDLLDHKLGANRYYWSISNPSSLEPEHPGCGDLLDDLGDIYKDLQRTLAVFGLDLPHSQENALWDFKFDFDSHWGTHCINALGAIHFFLQQANE